ncbi:hypothetical protein NSP_44750 [Nodularia spumigena CCY9414]|nr:hypothetical protein NSP_44750 [Nodularia spumigena CCY9414]
MWDKNRTFSYISSVNFEKYTRIYTLVIHIKSLVDKNYQNQFLQNNRH